MAWSHLSDIMNYPWLSYWILSLPSPKYSFGELGELLTVPRFFLRVSLLHCSTAESKQTLFVVTAALKTFSRSDFTVAQINHITDFIRTTFLVQCCVNAQLVFYFNLFKVKK